jgi:hypothetical protein
MTLRMLALPRGASPTFPAGVDRSLGRAETGGHGRFIGASSRERTSDRFATQDHSTETSVLISEAAVPADGAG